MPQRGGEYCHAAGDGEQEEDVDELHRLPYAPEYHGDYGDNNSMLIVMGQNAMAAGGTLANMPAQRAPHAARGLP